MIRNNSSQKSEITFLKNINSNLINEIEIKGHELEDHIKSMNNDIQITDLNGHSMLSDKKSTINKLSDKVDDLEKYCSSKTDRNRDLTIIKNDLTVELDKCRLDYNLLKENLGAQINLLNNSIKDTLNNFDT